MQLERIFITRNARNPALRPRRVAVRPFAFGDHGNRTVLRRFQGKAQARDPAPHHNEIEFLHVSRKLSINRVSPTKTASAISAFGRKFSSGSKFSASTMVMYSIRARLVGLTTSLATSINLLTEFSPATANSFTRSIA